MISAADSLNVVQGKIESYAGIVHECRTELGSAYFGILVYSRPILMAL
jgi:hypothetical protein